MECRPKCKMQNGILEKKYRKSESRARQRVLGFDTKGTIHKRKN